MYTRDAIVGITGRVRATLELARGRFPATADRESGSWDWSDEGAWLGGFWPGLLWLTTIATGDDELLGPASDAARRLAPRAAAPTAMRGLIFWYGAAFGSYLGLAPADVAKPARRAAASLVRAVDPAVGLVPPLAEDAAFGWPTPGVSVDALAGTVPLLAWAGHRDTAVEHARGTVRFCSHPDGGYAQTATYDEGGHPTGRTSADGLTPDSVLARSQAWAMLGLSHARPLHPDLKRQSDRANDWWLAHQPDDQVARWDFSAPVGQPLDTSASAIAAAALVQSGRHVEAERIVAALEQRHLTPDGRLVDGCLNYRRGLAVGNELVWGDFFLLEAAIGLQRTSP